jgi:hypothetical protein
MIEWWSPAGGGVMGARANPQWRRIPSTSAGPFSCYGRNGWLEVVEFDESIPEDPIVCWDIRLTYEDARTVLNGLADHPGPQADAITDVIERFLAQDPAKIDAANSAGDR